jgi:hypothetical protein
MPQDGFGQKIFGVPAAATLLRERSAVGRAAICSRVTSSTKPTAIGSFDEIAQVTEFHSPMPCLKA